MSAAYVLGKRLKNRARGGIIVVVDHDQPADGCCVLYKVRASQWAEMSTATISAFSAEEGEDPLAVGLGMEGIGLR